MLLPFTSHLLASGLGSTGDLALLLSFEPTIISHFADQLYATHMRDGQGSREEDLLVLKGGLCALARREVAALEGRND